MSEKTQAHDPEQAEISGYADAMYDGMDLFHCEPCRCDECWAAYYYGQGEAIKALGGATLERN